MILSSKFRLAGLWLFSGLLLLLSGCGGHYYHVVERGETLYSIGWTYGYDYRDIARWNGIRPPYALKVGQRLKVTAPAGDSTPVVDYSLNNNSASQTAKNKSPTVRNKKPASQARQDSAAISARKKTTSSTVVPAVKGWRWPVRDKRILSTFLASDPARQGLNFAGVRGNPVFAAANGHVVYAGSGLPRYGKLIIIKHNELFLSAYAHNHKLHVKEGEAVKVGQKIADMGSTGADRVKLYFEIRRNGKPVDPMRYLPK